MHKYHFDWEIHNVIIRWSLSLKSCPKIRMCIQEERKVRRVYFFFFWYIICKRCSTWNCGSESIWDVKENKSKTQREWLTCPLLQMWGLIWPHYKWLGSSSMLFGLPTPVTQDQDQVQICIYFCFLTHFVEITYNKMHLS